MLRRHARCRRVVPRAVVAAVALSSRRSLADAVVIGDPSRGVRRSSDSICTARDVVGVGSGAVGGGTCVSSRLPAGEVLSLVDICAARAASKHVFGKFTMGFGGDGSSGGKKNDVSVATVAMDQMVFPKPIMYGDLIDLRGTVVDVGASSIAVNVDVRRIQFGSKEPQLVASALVFMVAVDSSLKAAKVVPALELDPSDRVWLESRHKHVKEARAHFNEMLAFEKTLTAPDANVETLLRIQPKLFQRDASKPFSTTIPTTRHNVNRLFFPSHLNLNNTVFGGELLRWMEAHAVHCGRAFSGNRQGIFTIGMHAIQFTQPVYKTDWMRLEAHVVYAKRSTMEVDVQVIADRDGKPVTTNRANFVLASLDEAGQKLALPSGLHVDPTDDYKWMRRHVLAERRYQTMHEARVRMQEAAAVPAATAGLNVV